MADDEMTVLDRVRDRLGAVERVFERLDERITGISRDKLGKDDATMLMEYAMTGDGKLREDFLSRLGDFRIEVREGFKHNEKETAAAIYKAVTESETKITTAIAALNASIAALAQTPDPKRGIHPVVPYGGGAAVLASAVWLVLFALGIKPPGFN